MAPTAKKSSKIRSQKLKLVNTSDDLEAFLLNGPTFSKEQLKIIENNRRAINKWREK